MCITFFSIGNKKSEFPFVMGFNRDELTTRVTTYSEF